MDKTDPTRSQDGDGSNAAATNGQRFRIGTASYDVAGSLNGRMAYLAIYKDRILLAAQIKDLDTQLPIKLP